MNTQRPPVVTIAAILLPTSPGYLASLRVTRNSAGVGYLAGINSQVVTTPKADSRKEDSRRTEILRMHNLSVGCPMIQTIPGKPPASPPIASSVRECPCCSA
jgi:hypothetical protein